MAKVDWNEFVDSHKSGHGVGDADGKKPASVRSVLLGAVAAAVTSDWSVMSTN